MERALSRIEAAQSGLIDKLAAASSGSAQPDPDQALQARHDALKSAAGQAIEQIDALLGRASVG
ncbi:MAG: hypothetical protein R3E02_05400 [Blastomonas sp.]